MLAKLNIGGGEYEQNDCKRTDSGTQSRASDFGVMGEIILSEISFAAWTDSTGGVNESKIKASFSKGILSIELPKTAEAKKAVKKIAVKLAD